MSWYHEIEVQITLFTELALVFLTIPWILTIKKDSTSAVAWCLTVILVPILGAILFLIFGYQHVNRPLKRKRRHKMRFSQTHLAGVAPDGQDSNIVPDTDKSWEDMARLASRFGAFPVTSGNQVDLYHEGRPAFDAMIDAIENATHHVHLEFFIFQPDRFGRRVLDLLTRKARMGVEIRLLYDAMGSHKLSRHLLKPLHSAGGKSCVFLPINVLRRRIQINMRNHRKLLIVDGQLGFTGGLNVGDEYRSEVKRFGFWRDTHLRLQGPAVAGLQRIFMEDWDFAAGDDLKGASYYPKPASGGPHVVQIVHSGPDLELNSIREVYFAAILRAKRRLWIATPYFIPDAGLRNALTLAAYSGVDVRLLCQYHPDKWIPLFAGRYYWDEMLKAGVRIYQYTNGMMHSKVITVDDEWASVGSANFDNRSLYLNFEANCLLYSPDLVANLDEAFLTDFRHSIRLKPQTFTQRPLPGRMMENACRLLSPVL